MDELPFGPAPGEEVSIGDVELQQLREDMANVQAALRVAGGLGRYEYEAAWYS